MTKERSYISIDLKSFFASVECVERGLDPLTTKLVVADESRTEKTICLAVTPALKALGLGGRCRLFEVVEKAKEYKARTNKELEYIVAMPRMAKYVEYSTRIFGIYMRFISPEDIHVYSIDEVFMDVTDYLKLYQMTPRELAIKMIKEVLKETGITATAGIGTNLYLAKVAMDIVAKKAPADEDGVRIAQLDERSYREKLWGHRNLIDFWRMGAGTIKRLNSYGMYTMGDVARMSLTDEDLFYKIFGVDAEILLDHAWGYEPVLMKDIKSYHAKTKSLSSGQVLHEPYTNEKARIIVKEMTELLVLDLVDKGLATSSVTITIGYDRINCDVYGYDGPATKDYYGRMVPKAAHGTANLGGPSSSTQKIRNAVIELFDSITDDKLLIRRINICANKVEKKTFEQLDLFTDPNELEKEKKLQKAMLEIQHRFGKNAILKGTNLEEGATTVDRNAQIGGHKA